MPKPEYYISTAITGDGVTNNRECAEGAICLLGVAE